MSSEPSAVDSRLDRIEASLERIAGLLEVLVSRGGVPAGVVEAESSGAAVVAPSAAPVAMESSLAGEEQKPEVGVGGLDAWFAEVGPAVDDDGNVIPGPWTTVEQVFAFALAAGLHPDEELAFSQYARVMHSEAIEAPQAMTHLKVFQWRQFRKRVRDYLRSADDPTSFEIARRNPASVTDADRSWKIFMKSKVREPVPTLFRRDFALGGAWRIDNTSL
jgi:hypothetical protein